MRVLFFASVSALSAAGLVFTAACGGGSSGSVKSPETTASTAATPASAQPAAPVATSATTTTVVLGDGGDLTGAKLSSSSTTVVETPNAPAKPAAPKGPEAGRSPDDIRVLVMAHRDEARACYDKALKDHPGIQGDLTIKWVIDPKGNVTEPAVDDARSTIHEPSVGLCIIDVIKKIRFSESPKGFETRTSYPFNFNPRSAGKLAAPDAGH